MSGLYLILPYVDFDCRHNLYDQVLICLFSVPVEVCCCHMMKNKKYYYILQLDGFFCLDPHLYEDLVTLVGKGSLIPSTHITIINEDA